MTAELIVGFPDVDGYTMHSYVDCRPTGSIELWFHRPAPDLSSMINVHVFLLDAALKHANVELSPFFPPLKSVRIVGSNDRQRDRNLLTITFEKGEISFVFASASHVTRAQPVGHIPAAMKRKLPRKRTS